MAQQLDFSKLITTSTSFLIFAEPKGGARKGQEVVEASRGRARVETPIHRVSP